MNKRFYQKQSSNLKVVLFAVAREKTTTQSFAFSVDKISQPL